MYKGILDGSFVREAFYLSPPESKASPDEWNRWLEADRLAASKAKRKHTLSCKHAERPDADKPTMMAKVGGVYRQSSLVGLVGSADTGFSAEPAIEAKQDLQTKLTPWVVVGGRGVSKRKSGSARRKAKRRRN